MEPQWSSYNKEKSHPKGRREHGRGCVPPPLKDRHARGTNRVPTTPLSPLAPKKIRPRRAAGCVGAAAGHRPR